MLGFYESMNAKSQPATTTAVCEMQYIVLKTFKQALRNTKPQTLNPNAYTTNPKILTLLDLMPKNNNIVPVQFVW